MSLLSAVLQEANKTSAEDMLKKRDELLPKLVELSERLQIFSWALQNYFTDIYCNFLPSKSLDQLNYYTRKDKVLSDYEKLQDEVQLFLSQFCGYVDDVNNACMQLDTEMQTFIDLCTVVDGINMVAEANRDFCRYNYVGATTNVKSVLICLRDLNFEGKLNEALENFMSQTEHQLALFMAYLTVDWENIFTWREKKGLCWLNYSMSVQQNDPNLLKKVLKSMYILERMHIELQLFSQFFMEDLVKNVVKFNCEIFTEDCVGALVFNVKVDTMDFSRPHIQNVFNNLTAVFEFIESTLGSQFEADKKLMEIFGDTIRDKFFDKIINDCIRSNLPSCNSSYQTYREIVVELESFNKFLIDLKFVSAHESPLNKYIYDTDRLLYDKKCEKLLAEARELFNECLPHGTEFVGTVNETENESLLDISEREVIYDVNNPLFLPKCVISKNVKKVVNLIIMHLEESARLPEDYGQQLILYIKDIAVMYQTIVPKKFRENLDSNPLEIALFFNNCYYLAHSLLGPPWKNMLPKSQEAKLNVILMDDIHDLRIVGLEKLSLYLQRQKTLITRKLEENILPWVPHSFDVFDRAVNFTNSRLRELKDSWYNILPARMYELAMCTLVQTACQCMVERLFLDVRPIKESLVYMLALRFETTIADFNALFPEPIKLQNKVEGWLKFSQVPKLFRAQVLEITNLWNGNTAVSQSYTCEEIRQIIKMRFPDSKYRLKILIEIQ